MRYVLPILGLLILIAGLGGVKFAQISSLIQAGKAAEAAGPPPEAVSTAVAQEMVWEGTLSAVGSVVAERGVVVSNDSPGVVTRIRFESGDTVKRGQVLVELDSGVERAQIASARARLELARQTITRTRSLAQSNTVTQAKVDQDEAQLRGAETDVSALQAQIDRKTVRAAFDGRLGIREVNLGQYLAPGTQLTTLESLDSVFVDFTLPQQSLSDVKPGVPVRVTAREGDRSDAGQNAALTAQGTIAAVNPSVDASTRAIRLRASIPNADQKLRPGMFVDVAVVMPQHGKVVAIPATAVVHASYGDSVFVAEDAPADDKTAREGAPGVPTKNARQQFVRVGEARGDFVVVLDGIKSGQEVVSGGAFKLRNGAKILVNNSVPQPEPSLQPRPENK